jgi:hypothetical protein
MPASFNMSNSPSLVAHGDLPAGDVDPDYLYFLNHIRVDGDSYVLDLPPNGGSQPSLLKYEVTPSRSSDVECISDPSPGCLGTNHGAEERDSSASLEGTPAWYDSLHDADEDYRLFLQHTRLVDGQLVLEIGGVVVNYDQPVAVGPQGKKDNQRGTETVVPSLGKGNGIGAGRDEDEVVSSAPVPAVPERYAYDWRADPSPGREVKDKDAGDDGLPDSADAGMTKGVHWESSSSDGPRARRRTNSVTVRNSDTSNFMSLLLLLPVNRTRSTCKILVRKEFLLVLVLSGQRHSCV